ncbi:NPC1-like intracellular cholesterol transporter 1 [Trachemys scripta elegans]|uniref:NPC1-like intracellular cholesterol transporter 1 n=1 Tax=Trachemys scripta elegans TaxID=31138 RepID=UPI001557FDE6|nr:NPC1-like intracellular cholesterol transporter 1 [Trachemys scripta elegans]
MLGRFPLTLVLLSATLGLAAAALTETHQAGYCSFYGECGRNPEINVSLLWSQVPCLSNTPARLLKDATLSKLKEVCPRLYTGENATYACCSYTQLVALQLSLAISQAVLTRCPACSENFANIYCQNICSPNQSLFTNVTRFFNRSTGLGRQVGVLEYQCFYNQSFADQSYDSCKGVRIPATGGYAIAAMCGKYGATLCNSQRWLDFQGDSSNGLAPLDIDFQLVPANGAIGEGIVPLNSKTWSCGKAVSADGEPCSCLDCAESCPQIPAPTPQPPPFKVGSLDGVLFVCCLLFCLLTVLFGAFLVWRCVSRSRQASGEGRQRQRDQLTRSEKLSQATHRVLGEMFRRWGTMVASHPVSVILVSAVVVVGLSCGMVFIQLTTDPVELWSSPDSQARQEKDFYDQNFGPFFRTNQVILTAKGRPSYTYDSLLLGRKNFSGILSMAVLLDLLELQTRLQEIEVWSEKEGRNVTLKDVCYAPLNPNNASATDCCVNSLVQYFQNNRTRLEMTASQTQGSQTGMVDWKDHFLYCVNSPLSFKDITNLQLSCMADYGAPVFPFLAVGGYTGEDYSEAQALILTFSLNNYPRSDPRYAWVLLWEQRFLQVVREFQRAHAHTYTIAYMAERSLEDEINRTTAEDIPIFAISYLVIFLYIALALGEYSSCRRILVDSKVTLGLGGILVVLGAVFSSMGFYAYVGLPSSLVIIEVVPFLVLAVGADNIFIFVLEYQRSVREPGERREQHIGRVLGTVAPSMLLCSFSEATCFFLGSLTRMPAVRTFALNAALAVLFDFLLQMSMFVALVSLDARRQEAARLDLCCCHRLNKAGCPARSEGLLRPFMRRIYTPVLLNRAVRALVMLLFLFMFCAGIYLALQVPVGLNQELAMPKDSYMVQYFQYLNQYFMVGLPTYFVTTGGYNFSTRPGMNGVCSSTGCDNNSLTQKIQYATKFSNVSYLAIPASSWVDDFIDWLHPLSRCCRISSEDSQFCPSTNTTASCPLNCMRSLSEVIRPSVEQFNRFLPWFLHDMPNLNCPKGGLGAYDTAVKLGPDGEIQASRFMAYHTPLTNSQEYTAALRAARALATNITHSMRRVPGTDPNFRVFPYTVTYVFYEQYLTIVNEGLFNLALCLVPTFAVCCVLLGMDLRSGLINLFTIVMILVDTVGAMTLWDISYNAISLINLVTAVGISVEFVSHLTRAFAVSTQPTRLERAKEATINMGSAVFAGVAMTNLPGIVVLAFAKAQLIQIFFFRLNLLITLLGLLHGLVFLPVLLSYFGARCLRPSHSPAEAPQPELEKRSPEGSLTVRNPSFQDKEEQSKGQGPRDPPVASCHL